MVKSIFELRHIFAHEVNAKNLITDSFMDNSISLCSKFLGSISQYVDSILYPDYPITQSEINQHAYETLNLLMQKYDEIESDIKLYIESNFAEDVEYLDKFKRATEFWKAYIDSDADFQADMNAKGGK